MSDTEYEVVDGLRIRKSTPKSSGNSRGLKRQRLDKGDREWRKLWGHERANLCRQMGITDPERIKELINCPNLPEEVRVALIKYHQKKQEEAEVQVNKVPGGPGVR